MTTINKHCKVTNHSSVPVMTLSAFNTNNQTSEIGYAQTLEILYAEDKSCILEKNSVHMLPLNRMEPNPSQPGSSLYCMLYELIFVEPKTLFPVQNSAEMINFLEGTYPDITLQATHQKRMNLALQFYQAINAYPTSNLAKDFCQTVQKSLNNSDSASDANKKIDQFFSSTKQYQGLDYNSYVILASYLQCYANIWACNQESYTYYFYNANSSSSNSTTAPVYQGKLIFNKISTSAIANPQDANGGYRICYINPAQVSTEIFYNNGQFVSDIHADIPQICLQGTFIVQSQFTNKKTDTQIIPILCGSIYDQKVIGSYSEQSKGSSHSGWYDFWHPTSLTGWISLILQLFGIIQLIHFICHLFMSFIKKIRKFMAQKKADLSDKEVDQVRKQIEDDTKNVLLKEQEKLLNRLNDNLELPTEDEIDTRITQLRELISGQMALKRATLQQDILKNQGDQLSELAEYGVNEQLEMTANNIFQASENVNKGINDYSEALKSADIQSLNTTGQNLANVVRDTQTLTDQINENLATIRDEFANSLSAATESSLESAKEAIADVNKIQNEVEERNSEIEEGEVDEDTDYLDWDEIAL